MSVPRPSPVLNFLAWVAATPRRYGETMEAWRTSCPRLSVWEDATEEGLVALVPCAGGQSEQGVALTERGRERLRDAS